MKLIIFMIFILQSLVSCTAKRAYGNEYANSQNQSLINRYQVLKNDFIKKHNVDIENIVRYRALRFINASFWDRNKERIGYLPWMTYGRKNTKKEIIDADPKVWMYWERGDHFSKNQWSRVERDHYLTMENIRELHLNIVEVSIMSKYSVIRKGARPGKIRSKAFQKAPGWNSKCKKHPMKAKTLNFFLNYDLKDSDGEPLVRVRKSKSCKRKPGYFSFKINYLSSPDVPKELQRLLNFVNNKWESILEGKDLTLTPIEFIADVQRWFVSIHPFGDGNGRTSRVLQDTIARSFGLPYPPSGYLTNDITLSKADYRISMKQNMLKIMSELERCMVEYDKRAGNIGFVMNRDCSQTYMNIGNQYKSQSKRVFKSYLNRFLNKEVWELEELFDLYPVPSVD